MRIAAVIFPLKTRQKFDVLYTKCANGLARFDRKTSAGTGFSGTKIISVGYNPAGCFGAFTSAIAHTAPTGGNTAICDAFYNGETPKLAAYEVDHFAGHADYDTLRLFSLHQVLEVLCGA